MVRHRHSGCHETNEAGVASAEVTVPLSSSLTETVREPSSGLFHPSFHTASVSLSLTAIRPALSTRVNRAQVTSHA